MISVDPAVYPNRKAIESLALKYSLALPERQKAARAGELAGRRTGSSVEYQDRKDYTLGDDLRYIDWRSYARNDRLTVKLFREEITPILDIFLDCSASMSVTAEKARLRLDLGYLFSLLGQKLHASVRLHRLGSRINQMHGSFDLLKGEDEQSESPLPLLSRSPAARRAGIKVFISDLLFPFQPPELITAFPTADLLIIVQTLSVFEANPAEAGAFRLEDAESAHHLDLRLDKKTIDTYMSRLNRLTEDVNRCVRAAGGRFATLREDRTPEQECRELAAAGIITV